MAQKEFKFEIGGVQESDSFTISYNEGYGWANNIGGEDPYTKPCPHSRVITKEDRINNKHIISNHVYVCPRVVVAYNEGGHNSTAVCLDCIIEAAKTLE